MRIYQLPNKSMMRDIVQVVLVLCYLYSIVENGNFKIGTHAFTTITSTSSRWSSVVPQQLTTPTAKLHYEKSSTTAALTNNDETVVVQKTALKEELLTLLGGRGGSYRYDDDDDDDDDDDVNNDDDEPKNRTDDERFMEETLFVDPITKIPLRKRIVPSKRLIVGGGGIAARTPARIQTYVYSSTTTGTTSTSISSTAQKTPSKYIGTSDTYINLLEPYTNDSTTTTTSNDVLSFQDSMTRIVLPFVPVPLRSILVNQNKDDDNTDTKNTNTYIPMRDLFTSPTVSYLYERGWRQGFTQAGFPGVDTESIMAYDYLQPALIGTLFSTSHGILVDMSCATGLFTRKFLRRALHSDDPSASKKPIIRRLIGADYSDAMLREARQRINNDETIQELVYNNTARMDNDFTFELVRLDVGKIPMRNNSVDALHAGAAMHCWPDMDMALSEIYRVLRPSGGRYFATTFLANYFRNVQGMNNQQRKQIEQQTFQYFKSVEDLRALLIKAGFHNDKIQIDVVGPSCVIIRCEK